MAIGSWILCYVPELVPSIVDVMTRGTVMLDFFCCKDGHVG